MALSGCRPSGLVVIRLLLESQLLSVGRNLMQGKSATDAHYCDDGNCAHTRGPTYYVITQH